MSRLVRVADPSLPRAYGSPWSTSRPVAAVPGVPAGERARYAEWDGRCPAGPVHASQVACMASLARQPLRPSPPLEVPKPVPVVRLPAPFARMPLRWRSRTAERASSPFRDARSLSPLRFAPPGLVPLASSPPRRVGLAWAAQPEAPNGLYPVARLVRK